MGNWAIDVHHYFHNPAGQAEILAAISETKGAIMATQQELAADLAAVSANVEKIGGETRSLIEKIDELTAAVEAAGNTTPEVDAALQALKDQVAVVDALVPDAPPAGGDEPPPVEPDA